MGPAAGWERRRRIGRRADEGEGRQSEREGEQRGHGERGPATGVGHGTFQWFRLGVFGNTGICAGFGEVRGTCPTNWLTLFLSELNMRAVMTWLDSSGMVAPSFAPFALTP